MLAERGVPFILHVGSSPLNIADEWMNDGVSERQSARGRAEVIGSKDLMVIYHEDVKRACYSDNFDCLNRRRKEG